MRPSDVKDALGARVTRLGEQWGKEQEVYDRLAALRGRLIHILPKKVAEATVLFASAGISVLVPASSDYDVCLDVISEPPPKDAACRAWMGINLYRREVVVTMRCFWGGWSKEKRDHFPLTAFAVPQTDTVDPDRVLAIFDAFLTYIEGSGSENGALRASSVEDKSQP